MQEINTQRRVPIAVAISAQRDILEELTGIGGLQILEPASSVRRFEETVDEIILIGVADDTRELIRVLVSLPQVEKILDKWEDYATVTVSDGLRATLRLVDSDSFGSALLHYTGSSRHNAQLCEFAYRTGLRLSEEGITDLETGKFEKIPTEELVYERLGLQYIPPEIRDGREEIERAEQGEIPELIELTDIKGDLHVHTTWSDGRSTMREMVLAAKSRGYSYIGIADHSSSPRIAGGKGYHEQSLEIEKLNGEIDGIHILRGAEVNIMPDGALEIADEYLAELDFVIAAVHHGLDLPRKQMTNRIITAMENPHVDILAHPTSRRVLPVPDWIETGPVDADMEAVFQAAARTNTILEIDSMPSRLDLNDTYVYRARELGLKLSIDTDSHQLGHLEYMDFGVRIARRGWCRASDVVNTKPLDGLTAFFKR